MGPTRGKGPNGGAADRRGEVLARLQEKLALRSGMGAGADGDAGGEEDGGADASMGTPEVASPLGAGPADPSPASAPAPAPEPGALPWGKGPPARRVPKRGREASGRGGTLGPGGGAAGEGGPFEVEAVFPSARFSDLGGLEGVMDEVRELVEWPLCHPEIYAHLGVAPPRGVLLHGPPGCGKSLLAMAMAGEFGMPMLRVSAPELVSGMSGESEARIRGLFAQAAKQAPCLVFVDEIDAIAPKRENAQREMERRIVAQLLTCMDDLGELGGGVVVLGATNRPDALDSALRRAGRFDREIALPAPDEAGRRRILDVMCRALRLEGSLELGAIARATPGFVGADLSALTKEAAAAAVGRIFRGIDAGAGGGGGNEGGDGVRLQRETLTAEQLEPLAIGAADFEVAVKKVQPSVKREGFATVPDCTWDDVGALEEVREELSFAVTRPIQDPELFAAMGLGVPTGVLLYGPPGCGKTLVAKATANECGANFISVKGPELLNKFVGESEKAVRQVFARGRQSAPCVIFFDELDALCPKRGSDGGGNQSAERVVNQLLTEMDGLEARRDVWVIAATNRPDMIDPAMLRPGRLGKLLYVPLPTLGDRLAILEKQAGGGKTPLDSTVDLAGIAQRTEGFSGADLHALVREAAVAAIKGAVKFNRLRGTKLYVGAEQFEQAFRLVQPSVSERERRRYEALRKKLRHTNLMGVDAPGPGDAVPASDPDPMAVDPFGGHPLVS